MTFTNSLDAGEFTPAEQARFDAELQRLDEEMKDSPLPVAPPVLPEELVPEKPTARPKNWFFTLNPKDGVLPTSPWPSLPKGVKYLVYQKEQGSQQTAHYQGYVQFSVASARTAAKKKLGFDWIHLQPAQAGAEICKQYCTKCCNACYAMRSKVDCDNCDRLEGPFEFGKSTTKGQRSDRAATFAEIKEKGYNAVLLENPASIVTLGRVGKEFDRAVRQQVRNDKGWSPPEIRVITGPTGCGKSKLAWSYDPQLYPIFSMGKSVWFDGYHGQKTLFIDEFHSNLPISDLLKWLDGYPSQFPVKNGSEVCDVELIIICSNVPVKDWYSGGQVPENVRAALFNRIYVRFGLHLDWCDSIKDFKLLSSENDTCCQVCHPSLLAPVFPPVPSFHNRPGFKPAEPPSASSGYARGLPRPSSAIGLSNANEVFVTIPRRQ